MKILSHFHPLVPSTKSIISQQPLGQFYPFKLQSSSLPSNGLFCFLQQFDWTTRGGDIVLQSSAIFIFWYFSCY